MRLDMFLKNTHLAKRRSQAKREAEGGDVTINGRTAKPSSKVNIGDEILLKFENVEIKFKVVSLPERPIKRSDQEKYLELLGKERIDLF